MVNVKGDETKILGALNVVMVKKDLGATFADVATELAAFDVLPALAIMENTNATGSGVRFYVKADATTGWKYAALT